MVGVKDFIANINLDGESSKKNPMDRKLFYLFENNKMNNYSKSKKSSGSEHSKNQDHSS